MLAEVTYILELIQIVVQFTAAYFSYVIYKYNRLYKAWLAVVVGLVLMAFRRVTALLIELSRAPASTDPVRFLDRVLLPFTISVLLLWGLWSMKKNFESFEVVEKRVSEKVKSLNKFRKKKRKV